MAHKIERCEALKIIENEILENPNFTPTKISKLSPIEIKTMTGVFQQRELDGRLDEDNRHVETLMKAIKSRSKKIQMLDPMIVWSSNGKQWYVIDGHHRLLAYRKLKIKTSVPVTVFSGTLTEAIEESMKLNSKDRLLMTLDEKLNAAWFLIVLGEASKNEIIESTTVSYGTVSTMRKIQKALMTMINEETGLQYTDVDLLGITEWKAAVRLERGEKQSPYDWDPDEALKKDAARMRGAIYRALKDMPQRKPEAFAMALRSASKDFPRRLAETHSWSGDIEALSKDMAIEYANEVVTKLTWDIKLMKLPVEIKAQVLNKVETYDTMELIDTSDY